MIIDQSPDTHLSPTARVTAAYRRIAEADRPEIWITLREQADVLGDAAAVEQRVAAGERLPLAGLVVAAKTTSTSQACRPPRRAPSSPNSRQPRRWRWNDSAMQGPSSSAKRTSTNSAPARPVPVVPTAPCAIRAIHIWSPEAPVPVPPSPSRWASPTSASAPTRQDPFGSPPHSTASSASNPLSGSSPPMGSSRPAPATTPSVYSPQISPWPPPQSPYGWPDFRDPRSRSWPAERRAAAPTAPRLAIPAAENLTALSPGYRDAFEQSVRVAIDAGLSVEPIDISVLLDAALLLYDGAIVAERYAAVGEFLDSAPAGADPTVAAIITAAREISGPAFAADLNALAHARADAADLLDGFDALLLPTTTEHPTLAEVQADPFSINRRLGTYTNFCNLLDMAAVAVPGVPTTTGTPFGVMLVVPAFNDQIAADIAARLIGATIRTLDRKRLRFGCIWRPLTRTIPALATRTTRRTLRRPDQHERRVPPPGPRYHTPHTRADQDEARTGSARPG